MGILLFIIALKVEVKYLRDAFWRSWSLKWPYFPCNALMSLLEGLNWPISSASFYALIPSDITVMGSNPHYGIDELAEETQSPH